MTPLFLVLAALPSLLAIPCPYSDIYYYAHSSCYNTATKPCTMNFGGGKSKSLLTVKVQKRGSFVSTCHKTNGRKHMFLSHYHCGYSDGGRVLDQNREKKQEQVIKNINSQLQSTPEPYKRLDLLSHVWPFLKPPSGNQHLTCLLNSSFQFFQYTQHTSHMHVTVSLTAHGNSFTCNLALTGQLYLPFPTKNYTTHWANLWQRPTLNFFKPNL